MAAIDTAGKVFTDWVDQQLAQMGVAWAPQPLVPVSGDAGFRHYYRVPASNPPVLAVYAPPATERNREFVQVATLLRDGGVNAPVVLACDLDRGFLLISDLGETLYQPCLNDDSADALYGDALQALLRVQQISAVTCGLEPYDAAKLQREMALFPEWFVEKLLGVTLTDDDKQLLASVFGQLIRNAEAQPQVVVHRDYHSRNLLRTDLHNPGVIDFQDAVIGPITYDAVSLLRDCYIHWPQQRVVGWALAYHAQLITAGLVSPSVTSVVFLHWFDGMGLQRHLKVLGIFSRLYLRDHKPRYLEDLPLVIAYTLAVAKRYPEWTAFATWFEQRLLPIVHQQQWFRVVVLDA